MLRNWKVWLGIVISLIALYLIFKDVNFQALGQSLATAQLIWFVPGTLAFFATIGLRGWRWSVLLDNTPFWPTMHAYNIGYMMNMLIPLRAGEVGKAYALSQRTSITMTRALSSIVVERFLDLSAVLIMFAGFAQIVPMPPQFVTAATIGGVLILLMVLVFGFVLWQSARVETLIKTICRYIPKLNSDMLIARFRDIRASFALISTPRKLFFAILLTVGVWATSIMVMYFLMGAFMPTAWVQAGFVSTTTNLGGALPSAPGGLGVVQIFATQSLVIPFGIDSNVAVAFAFVSVIYQEILLIIFGFIGLARMGLQFSNINRKQGAQI